MQIVNSLEEDYHIHCLQFSNGLHSIDEIVRYAGEIGLKKIAITDHSQAKPDEKYKEFQPVADRKFLLNNRWKNVWNNVEVVFGVEGDLLDESGEICDHIQGVKGDFLILSSHRKTYRGDPRKINEAYENAIVRYYNKINLLGHPDMDIWGDNLDIEKLVANANKYDIPMEFNCGSFVTGVSDLKKLDVILKKAKYVYINSDAHTLADLRDHRKIGYEFLKNNYGIGVV